jgi:hypothetical protein
MITLLHQRETDHLAQPGLVINDQNFAHEKSSVRKNSVSSDACNLHEVKMQFNK